MAISAAALLTPPTPALATDATASQVTDKVYVDVKGLPSASEGGGTTTKRIVIGLFGTQAPRSAAKLKALFSSPGLSAGCKPREERLLQREQLEANKVYNSCVEGQDKGVTYDYAQIWRVVQGERLDFGSVAGKYIAREFPDWQEDPPSLSHDRPGLVSVRRGSDSGFGFTIYPGVGGGTAGADSSNLKDLNENHTVVGQVLEGMDVVEQINQIPVVNSAKVNYMALTGGPAVKNAPTRACRYGGGALCCNENKPLVKLTMYRTGVL